MEETEWAGVTEGGDWAGETRSYGVVKGEPGEEHSGKKRQARNVGDDRRGLRAGLSWAGGGAEPSTRGLSSYLPCFSSSLQSLTCPRPPPLPRLMGFLPISLLVCTLQTHRLLGVQDIVFFFFFF